LSRRGNTISGQFAARLVEMLESPAYRVLSLSARRVIDRIEIEMAHHGGKDNGNLPVTFEHFHEYGIHRHSIAPAIREAEALGFLVITEKGRAGNAEYRSPNLFRLTYRHAKGIPGDGSHEWRRVASVEEAEAAATAARKPKTPKTKLQCRKAPDFGDGIRHRKPKFPMPETITKPVAEIITTSISRAGESKHPAREARPPGSAVASGLAASERTEILQNRIALKLGDIGWSVLMKLTTDELATVTELERCGQLSTSALDLLRSKIAHRKETAA
jgi:hypothetical protein